MREATRKNGKRLYSIADAVETLRSNGFITAGRTDEATGEFFPLSEDTISRALRNYGLHPEQLDAPAPSSEMASLHPNHVWEIDASLCTLYYLSNGHKGLQVMDSAKFYKTSLPTSPASPVTACGVMRLPTIPAAGFTLNT